MSDSDLSRLEHEIGRVLRTGVLLSAIALAGGLAFALVRGTDTGTLLDAGLILLMAIPITRIAASFFDALRRHDRLLAWSTAIVLCVMALTIAYQFWNRG